MVKYKIRAMKQRKVKHEQVIESTNLNFLKKKCFFYIRHYRLDSIQIYDLDGNRVAVVRGNGGN